MLFGTQDQFIEYIFNMPEMSRNINWTLEHAGQGFAGFKQNIPQTQDIQLFSKDFTA